MVQQFSLLAGAASAAVSSGTWPCLLAAKVPVPGQAVQYKGRGFFRALWRRARLGRPVVHGLSQWVQRPSVGALQVLPAGQLRRSTYRNPASPAKRALGRGTATS